MVTPRAMVNPETLKIRKAGGETGEIVILAGTVPFPNEHEPTTIDIITSILLKEYEARGIYLYQFYEFEEGKYSTRYAIIK